MRRTLIVVGVLAASSLVSMAARAVELDEAVCEADLDATWYPDTDMCSDIDFDDGGDTGHLTLPTGFELTVPAGVTLLSSYADFPESTVINHGRLSIRIEYRSSGGTVDNHGIFSAEGVLGAEVLNRCDSSFIHLFLASGASVFYDNCFSDDDGNTHEGSIAAIAGAGITMGCNPPANDHYCPDDPVTREQIAAFLSRASGLPAATIDHFVDDDGSVFETEINRLAESGITRGCNPPANDRYCPTDLVTRGQMAAFLVRAMGYTDDGGRDWFTDDDGSVFEADIDKLATAGVTFGCNPPANTEYCPDDPVRRDQMASFLARALQLDVGTPSATPID